MQLYLTLVIVWSQLAPAPGEIVAAIYPPDGQWYRAMVISLTNHDQSVEVRIYYSQRTLFLYREVYKGREKNKESP